MDAIEESIEEEGSYEMARQKSQEASIKVTQFARPSSPDGALPGGFTFMKPKLPQMDFSRKPVHQTSLPKVQRDLQETSAGMCPELSPVHDAVNNGVKSLHFPPPNGTESAIPANAPQIRKIQDNDLNQEDLVTCPEIFTVRIY